MQPKVSIFMITYNHERFIAQAIESVLSQTYENIELVIGEDCSTDNTREIVLFYKRKYPNKIKLILNKKNVGMHYNTQNVIRECDGKYVALIEGDDYWTDIKKLEKQVAFLEANEDYSICFHRAKVLNESTVEFAEYLPSLQNNREEFSIFDFIDGVYMPTASTVFRNKFIMHFPDWFFNLSLYIDRTFHLLNGQYGRIKFMNDCMSVYRVHEGGFWSVNQDKRKVSTLKERIYLLENFDSYSHEKYTTEINEAIKKCEMEILVEESTNSDESHNEILTKVRNLFLDEIQNRNVLIFGTGRAGQKAFKFFNNLDIECVGFLDNDIKKWGQTLFNFPINNPNDFNYKKTIVFIASEFHREIGEQLKQYGLILNKDYYVLLHFLMEKDIRKD